MKIQSVGKIFFTNKLNLISKQRIEKEINPDGGYKIYDGHGNVMCEHFSNGYERGYNGIGMLAYETYPDGSSVSYHRTTGKVCVKENLDASKEVYNGDGSLFIKRDKSGKIVYQSETNFYE